METNMAEERPTNENKTMKEYMRDYRRKVYAEKTDKVLEKNKAYYYKYKFKCSNAEFHKYDTLLPNVLRIRKDLDVIRDKNPSILNELLTPYL